MTTAATSLLGLALPVTGELSGTWGDTVNNSITSLLDSAVAGTTTLSTDADVTLTTTTLAANQAREAIILWTAAGTVTRTITAPAQSKTYVVINKSSTQSIKLVGAGPTAGITVLPGESTYAAWNGSDFVKVGEYGGNLTVASLTDSGLTSGRVTYATTAGLLTDSANMTFDGTTLTSTFSGPHNGTVGATTPNTGAFTTLSASSTVTLSGGTANGVAYLNGSKVVTTGSALTFDGTNLGIGTSSPFADSGYRSIDIRGTTGGEINLGTASNNYGQILADATNGLLLNTLGATAPIKFFVGGAEQMRVNNTGLGIGTSSPAQKLDVVGNATASGYVNSNTRLRVTGGGNAVHWLSSVSDLVGSGSTTDAAFGAYGSFNWYPNNGTTLAMKLDSSGNLGIGTSSPAYKLDILGATPFVRLQENTTGYLGFRGQNTSGNFYFGIDSSAGGFYGSAYARVLYSDGAYPMVFYTNATERMRLDSSGNLGIGTSSPANPLNIVKDNTAFRGQLSLQTVTASNFAQLTFYDRTTLSAQIYHGYSATAGVGDFVIQTATASSIAFGTTNTERMRLDSSGNLGLGVTPSTGWSAPAKAFQISGTGSIAGYGSNEIDVSTNIYYSGGYKYLTTAVAASYQQNAGQHQWYTAPSGTAGNAITFTQAMTLDASGVFLLGTTNVGATNSNSFVAYGSAGGFPGSFIANHLSGTSSGQGYGFFCYNGTVIGSITQSGTTAVLYNVTSDQRLKENIVDADSASSLVDALQVRQYDWKADGSHQRYGFVAQELVTVAPEAVHQPADPEEMMAVDYSKLVPMLVKEIQDLRKRLAALEAK